MSISRHSFYTYRIYAFFPVTIYTCAISAATPQQRQQPPDDDDDNDDDATHRWLLVYSVYSLLENCCWTALWINPIYMLCVCCVHPVRGYHSKSTSFKFFLGQKLYKECYVLFFKKKVEDFFVFYERINTARYRPQHYYIRQHRRLTFGYIAAGKI